MEDLTPKWVSIPAKEKLIVPEQSSSNMLQTSGSFSVSPEGLTFDKLKILSQKQQILIGSATTSILGKGIFQGLEEQVYKFRVGDPDGDNLLWNGTNLSITGAITLTNSISSSDISDVDAYATDQDKQTFSTLDYDTPTGTGLFLDATHLGYYDTDAWKTYMDSSGNFYLGGSSGPLQWTASTSSLSIGAWSFDTVKIFKDGATDALSAGMAPADYPFYAGKKYVDRATAPFRVTPAGAVVATSATITGALTAGAGSVINGTYLTDGTVVSSKTSIAISGWTHNLVFSATNNVQVAWASGVIALSDGSTTYNITGANTGTMSAINYIYLDVDTSTTLLQTTTTYSDAIGDNKILIAVAENVAADKKATFQVYGGIGGIGTLLTTDNLAANCVTANLVGTNEIIANTANIANAVITNAKISDLAVSKLTAGTITSKAITLAVAAGTGDTYIAAGKTDFTNTESGFILGIDDSDSDLAKFYIGSPTKHLNFDGSTFTLTGLELDGCIVASSFLALKYEAGEDLAAAATVILADGGDKVQIGQGTTDDTEVACYETGGTLYFIAQPLKFHKDFAAGDTFDVEVWVRGAGNLDNPLSILLYEDDGDEPVDGGTYYESSTIAVTDIRDKFKKLTSTITISGGHSIDGDSVYWLVFKGSSNEDYRLKCNNNIYYNHYIDKEFESEAEAGIRLKKQAYAGSWPSGTWEEISGELYFKILVPTESEKVYYASPWGVGDDFPKISIGLTNNAYSDGDTADIIIQGNIEDCLVLDKKSVGDPVYLDFFNGRLTCAPVDILYTYAIGTMTDITGGLNDIKLNIETNLLLRAEL